MDSEDLREIEKRIGYEFKNSDLLQQAFVRKSYAKENGGEDNEVLEFIGDRVLDVLIVKWLTGEYGFYCSDCDDFDSENDWNEFCCEKSEGQLTELKKKLVKKETLADAVKKMELDQYLIMGAGDCKANVQDQPSVQEDLFEAIIGAVTLDTKWSFDEIWQVVEFMLEPGNRLYGDDEKSYVERIQEWSLKRFQELPDIQVRNLRYYEDTGLLLRGNEIRSSRFGELRHPANMVVNVQEYEKKYYVAELQLGGIKGLFKGCGTSKSNARADVCELAYHYLDEQDLLFSIVDEIENPNKKEAINQLETLARRGYFSIPEYEFKEKHDEDGNPVWVARCYIGEVERSFESTSASKKDAKKGAAFEMLDYVLNTK